MKNNSLDKPTIKKSIETIIFGSKWLLLPFYAVLIGTLVIYAYLDVEEFIHFMRGIEQLKKDVAMITFIELIDMSMIAALGRMIIIGGYHTYISKYHGKDEHSTSGKLKVKLGSALVGITSIALLQKSIDITNVDWDTLYKLGFVHCIFLLSVMILQFVDYFYEKSETFNTRHHLTTTLIENKKEENH